MGIFRSNARLAGLIGALAVIGASAAQQAQPANAGEWREFQGSWSAAGSVHTLPMGQGREASLADLSGTLLLAGPARPGVGFRGQAIALSDSETGMVGRATWTDEHGDQVFSEITGGGPAKGSHVSGRFVGGTGRYAGATGTYEFTWQYVLAAEDGTVQGRAVGLKGRVRAAPGTASSIGGRP